MYINILKNPTEKSVTNKVLKSCFVPILNSKTRADRPIYT